MAKRNYSWFPLVTGTALATAATGTIIRFDIGSIRESIVEREPFENAVTERVIIDLYAQTANAAGVGILAVGVYVVNEEMLVTTVGPAGDPGVDWSYWNQIAVPEEDNQGVRLSVDVTTRRKDRAAGKSKVFFYLRNAHASISISFFAAGRILTSHD